MKCACTSNKFVIQLSACYYYCYCCCYRYRYRCCNTERYSSVQVVVTIVPLQRHDTSISIPITISIPFQRHDTSISLFLSLFLFLFLILLLPLLLPSIKRQGSRTSINHHYRHFHCYNRLSHSHSPLPSLLPHHTQHSIPS